MVYAETLLKSCCRKVAGGSNPSFSASLGRFICYTCRLTRKYTIRCEAYTNGAVQAMEAMDTVYIYYAGSSPVSLANLLE